MVVPVGDERAGSAVAVGEGVADEVRFLLRRGVT